jgi:hypothetical protein
MPIKSFNFDRIFTKPEPKKPIEVTEALSCRHLAFAIVNFLDRQVKSVDDNDVSHTELLSAMESVKKAYKLPDDDSLKVTRIFTRKPC